MKRSKSILAAVLSIMLVLAVFPAHVFAAGSVSIEGVTQEAEVTYETGERKSLIMKVTNGTDQPIKNVTVEPDKSSAFDKGPFSKLEEVRKISSLAAGESKKIPFDATAAKDAEAKTYDVDFKVSYDGGEDAVQTILVTVKKTAEPEVPDPKQPEENTGGRGDSADGGSYSGGSGEPQSYNVDPVSVGGGSGTASVPRVIVSGFTTEPADVKAGSNFKLIIHIQNTSTKTAVNNMLFDLSTPTEGGEGSGISAPAFLPASGASSIFLDKIPAGGTKDISIDLNARADLIQKPYSIELSMKYEDGSANQFEGASGISIPVKQDARFEFSEFELSPAELPVGEEGNVTCSLYNLGRVKLYNVKAKFEGEGIKAKEVFVGNVESGATASIDGMITGEKETVGDGTIKMILSYEDEAGTLSTIEKTFTMPVVSMQETGMDMSTEPSAENNKFPLIPVIIGVVVILAAAVVVIYKVRKKKKAKAEEEGLEDELDRLIEDE